MKKTLTFLAVTLVAALPGPLFAQSRQDQQLAASMLMIQEQQQQTALAVAQLAEMIKAMGPRFDDVVEAQRKRLADLEATIRNIAPDISAIRSQGQDTATRIGSLKDEIDALGKTLTDLLREIAKLQVPAPAPVVDPSAPPVSQGGAPVVQPPAQTVTLPPQAGMTPLKLLEASRADYQGGRYSLAITGFEQLLQFFPNAEAAAPEAQYLIGESHAFEGRWTEAVAAYNAVIQRYPKSQFVADAYYKRGIAQSRLGQPEASRESFELAVKNFPDSDAGRMAKQRLPALPATKKP